MVTAIMADTMHIAMELRPDGIMAARSAGAVTGARPACGNKAAAEALTANGARRRFLTGAASSHMPSRSRTRPAITAVVTPTGQNACIGIGLMPVTGMSISALAPPISRRASCAPIAVESATPRPL